MKLNNNTLLQTKAYINGKWIDADDNKTFSVTNPANQAVITQVADCGKSDVDLAIDAANNAWNDWRLLTAKERAAIMKKWHDLIIANTDDLAIIMTAEQGKPLKEAKGEVSYGASFIEWYAEEGKRIYGDIIPSHKSGSHVLVLKQPVGVACAITPWNFPNAMITRKAAPALAAGCTFVVKPAEDTPLSALALAKLAEEAGIPPGVFNVVPSSVSKDIGEAMTQHKNARKLSFTGSTAVGKILIRQSAENVQKVSMELGGHAPFIIFEDADLEKAADGLMASKFRNAGQTCVCANRAYIHKNIADEFVNIIKDKVKKLNVDMEIVQVRILVHLLMQKLPKK